VKKLASLFVALFSLVWLTGAGWLPLAGTSASGLMLDGITTGIKAAYSTRKLLTVYAGNAVQVQRASDNATQNIGFVSNSLDTSSLGTFCSGTSCNVITWYDQSGGGFNLIQGQTIFAKCPIIYQSGAVNAINTKAAPLFVTANLTSLTNASLSANPTNTLFQNAVAKVSIAAFGALTGGQGSSGGLEWRVDQTTGDLELLKAGVASIGTSSSGVSSLTGAVVESQYNSSTGAWSFWINASAVGTGTSAQTMTASNFLLGAGFGLNADQDNLDGSVGELIMYDLVGGIPSGSRTAIEANQKAYWGTP